MNKNKMIRITIILAVLSLSAIGGCVNSEPIDNTTTTPTTTAVYNPPATSNPPVTTTPVVTNTQTPPTTTTTTPPITTQPSEPEVVDGEQLYREFKEDPEAAAAKYTGRTFKFENIRISDMVPLYKGTGTDWYARGGNVKFKPQYLSNLEEVKIGVIVDVVGEVYGLFYDLLVIENCWYTVIDDTDGVDRMQDTPFSFY
ncbi:MAG: hypothetical protein PHQ10_01560 [Dehalococcoidales bacterium]|nr:hypothetical protein [Dehalococcoidales bacterium]MDD3264753.1 hypothetical protein [Dehalococcoidales bacterium]MDD4793869.1 hypothetical protein [Dehalococcoidales bacterium]MDD5122360.1 hypothetical protein [Dehalococcoidales bacterium]MDD5498239.1 hypothetical protein [Dehalococcoidales bacterium]